MPNTTSADAMQAAHREHVWVATRTVAQLDSRFHRNLSSFGADSRAETF